MKTFEPDHVVDARAGSDRTRADRRDIALSDVLGTTGDSSMEVGLSAQALYRKLWQDEFRFVRRGAPSAVVPVSEDPRLALFTAACFGAFPVVGALSELDQIYRSALEAEQLPITSANLLDGFTVTAREQYLTPLALTGWELQWHTRRPRERATVLLVDEREPADIVDLWNLRALGSNVVPIPLAWMSELLEPLATRLRQWPGPRRSWDDTAVVVMGAHRVSESVVGKVANELRGHGLDALRSSYPDLIFALGYEAPVVEAAEADGDVLREGRFDRVRLLEPSAAEEHTYGRWRWVTVVNPVSWSAPSDGSVAAVIPETDTAHELLRGSLPLEVRSTKEGLVVGGGSAREDLECVWPTGTEALHWMLEQAGFEPKTSDPGYVAAELIRQVGGLNGAPIVQHKELIQLLNRAANQTVEITDDVDREQRRRPRVDQSRGRISSAS